jgi:hypothetical protein
MYRLAMLVAPLGQVQVLGQSQAHQAGAQVLGQVQMWDQ